MPKIIPTQNIDPFRRRVIQNGLIPVAGAFALCLATGCGAHRADGSSSYNITIATCGPTGHGVQKQAQADIGENLYVGLADGKGKEVNAYVVSIVAAQPGSKPHRGDYTGAAANPVAQADPIRWDFNPNDRMIAVSCP